jgi:hypothetical protein
MARGRRLTVMAGGLLLATALQAQEFEPSTLGLQVRASAPMGQLKDNVGDGNPGLGVDLVAEQDFGDGWRGRALFGADQWFKGNLGGVPGTKGGAFAAHLGVEAALLLRPYGDWPLLGPYVLAGLGGYAWDVTREDANGKTDRRVIHAGATVGAGWRVSGHMDVEIKGLFGEVDPDFNAAALMAGVTFRY